MRNQAVFGATLFCLFFLGQHLSVGVKESEVMRRFLSEVFNFKTLYNYLMLTNIPVRVLRSLEKEIGENN
jgi:hypothetical protein